MSDPIEVDALIERVKQLRGLQVTHNIRGIETLTQVLKALQALREERDTTAQLVARKINELGKALTATRAERDALLKEVEELKRFLHRATREGA